MKRMLLILSAVLALTMALPTSAQTPTTENLATPGATFEVGRFVSMTSDSITLLLRDGK